ncbi:MAG: TIGR03016 family PEP-CTERM system-associated outer membrane protein [Rubrivivax sp.]|nr:TIGR03016 family PEP-CTERM system-associated outer membrane protein [Rubrivivax sp.]
MAARRRPTGPLPLKTRRVAAAAAGLVLGTLAWPLGAGAQGAAGGGGGGTGAGSPTVGIPGAGTSSGEASPDAPAAVVPIREASRTYRLTPTFAIEQTFTDNVDLSSTDPQSDAITRLSPGVRIDSRGGLVNSFLSYTADLLFYARDSDRNEIQNSLSAAMTGAVVDDRFRIDALARISQRSISAFGTQTFDPALRNDNRTEVSELTISPAFQAPLGVNGSVSARMSWTGTNASSTDEGDSQSFVAEMAAGASYGLYSWSFSASRVVDDFKLRESEVTTDDVLATVGVSPISTLRLSLRGGWKSDDLVDAGITSGEFWGVGVDWQPHDTLRIGVATDDTYFGRAQSVDIGFFPTERTQLTLTAAEEVFGNTFALRFSHRMRRSLWTYTDTQGQNGGDLLNADAQQILQQYRRAYDECLRTIRDAALCDQLARLVVGLDPGGTGGFLNSASSIQRDQIASVTLTGIRTTLSFAAFQQENRAITGVSTNTGDLSQTDRVRQNGGSIVLSHRLTPTSSLSLRTSLRRTLDSGPLIGNELREAGIVYNLSLGARTSASVELRHNDFDSPTNPYDETALIGRIAFTF